MTARIDQLIINTPYQEPSEHWHYDRSSQQFTRVPGRRSAGYVVASGDSKTFDDPGRFVELPLVNRIRERVKAWRDATDRYAGVTPQTRRLLEHWQRPREADEPRLFFCQIEAVETIIWMAEAPIADRQPIIDQLGRDEGGWTRHCCKLFTGGGKTTVMAMVVAWHILNKVAYPTDRRFSKNVLVMAPGLTVRSRLTVLDPADQNNYYKRFDLVPETLMDVLRQGRILIRNWHALAWDTAERIAKRRSVDKRGAKSDEAYVREVLGDLADANNLLVLNDEAHHCHRGVAGERGADKDEAEMATIWVGGLDRIHRRRGIQIAYDFSATPFVPSGKNAGEDRLFPWVISDFGLNDAIESGLVKTPRVVIRDDGRLTPDMKSRFYHLYTDPEVKDDLNRKAEPQEALPQLVLNAYYHLGADWRETLRDWQSKGAATRPVMIAVVNRTETAARIEHAFAKKQILIDELCDPDRLLRIDSKVLMEAESAETPENVELPVAGEDGVEPQLTKKQRAELLRQQVDTVGQPGKPGAHLQNIISVGMLTEGWDARTVTHILGLRAFSSQLLCEQVVGRGLRRTHYDVNPETGFFEPEYVNIFGIPFTFLPHEGGEGTPPPPPKPKTEVKVLPDRVAHEIVWPNILRIEHRFRQHLDLDPAACEPLILDAAETPQLVELAPVVEGRHAIDQISQHSLERLASDMRLQRIIFKTASDLFESLSHGWKGSKDYLLAQLVRIVDRFISSDRLVIQPFWYTEDDVKRRLLIALNMGRIVRHLWTSIKASNVEDIMPVFDTERPIRSTRDMPTWMTSKPTAPTTRSHISHVVADSGWEASEAFELERSTELVQSYVKNDHLGFEIVYTFKGAVHKYRPDFLVRLANGSILVLEIKGQDRDEDKAKREALDVWIRAVNADGGFGRWLTAISRHQNDIGGILRKLATDPV